MKKFKHTIALIIIVLISFGMNTNAQSSGKHEQLKSLKIGFITESLELSPEEASSFWPIYNFHQDKIRGLHHQNWGIRRQIKGGEEFESMTDAKANELLKQLLKADKDMYNAEAEMFEKLSTVLSAKKILKLHKAENEFSRKILEQYRKRKEGQKK